MYTYLARYDDKPCAYCFACVTTCFIYLCSRAESIFTRRLFICRLHYVTVTHGIQAHQVTCMGAGAQSTLEVQDIFARKCMKN